MGEAKCTNPSLSWRPDGHVYGGTGSAKVTSQGDKGCNTKVGGSSTIISSSTNGKAALITPLLHTLQLLHDPTAAAGAGGAGCKLSVDCLCGLRE